MLMNIWSSQRKVKHIYRKISITSRHFFLWYLKRLFWVLWHFYGSIILISCLWYCQIYIFHNFSVGSALQLEFFLFILFTIVFLSQLSGSVLLWVDGVNLNTTLLVHFFPWTLDDGCGWIVNFALKFSQLRVLSKNDLSGCHNNNCPSSQSLRKGASVLPLLPPLVKDLLVPPLWKERQ